MAIVPDMLHMHLPKKYKETLLQASINNIASEHSVSIGNCVPSQSSLALR